MRTRTRHEIRLKIDGSVDLKLYDFYSSTNDGNDSFSEAKKLAQVLANKNPDKKYKVVMVTETLITSFGG